MANIYVVFQHIGYKRHPSIKNKLIIDEQVKDIVEKIFDMYANGQGSVEIVNFLNTNKYLSPTGYRKTGRWSLLWPWENVLFDRGRAQSRFPEKFTC